jgi:hypothetical protein
MTDLPQSVWREIEKAAFTVNGIRAQDGTSLAERAYSRKVIEVGTLKNILRKSRRTNDQNALLWALYDDVLKQGGETLAGWTKEDLHDFALGSYFGWDRYEAFGMKKVKPKQRSSRLAKSEFSNFVEHFVMQMAQHGIYLKLPGDLMRDAG